jgi:hypothetical protein
VAVWVHIRENVEKVGPGRMGGIKVAGGGGGGGGGGDGGDGVSSGTGQLRRVLLSRRRPVLAAYASLLLP